MTDPHGAVQAHVLGRIGRLGLPAKVAELFRAIRAALITGSDAKLLANSPEEIRSRLKLTAPSADIVKVLRQQGSAAGAQCIFGGAKNQHRSRAVAHFARNDGAWFDFAMTVREGAGPLELLAYDFELRLPTSHGTPFVRFDLNLPAHANQERELRCHLHPGTDRLLFAAPLFSPLELVDLFIHGARPDRDRHRTLFEVDWLRDELEQVAEKAPKAL